MKKTAILAFLFLFTTHTASAYTFPTNLKVGSRGPDVKNLQILLNSDPDTQIAKTGAGSPGKETLVFGPATARAVIKFQNKYKAETLTPAGLKKGTGFVGALTRKKLSTLGGGSTIPVVTKTIKPTETGAPTVLFTKNLSAGLTNDPEVKKLQTALSLDGSLYPERAITGNYDFYTVQAVKKFQDRYNLATPEQKLTPAYGSVGPKTALQLYKVFGGISVAPPVVTTPTTTPVITIASGGSGSAPAVSGGSAPTPSAPTTPAVSTPQVTTYTINTSMGPNGTISPAGIVSVPQGGSQAYTITPDPGYMVDVLYIDGVSVATSTTPTFTNIQSSRSISVTFTPTVIPAQSSTPTTYTLSLTNSGNGAIDVSPTGITCISTTCSTSHTPGTVVTLTATPNAGYTFSTWGGSCTGTATTCITTIAQATSVSATFDPIPVNPINLSLVPARTSGVAPLAVFFDASGTTDPTVTTRPFHDLEYQWNFGDPLGSPVSGTTWSTGSRAGVSSRNVATGPVAAHVFERPGTYTVTMQAYDGTNTNATTTTITVEDPDVIFAGTNTVCVASTITPTPGVGGCPVGAVATSTSNFAGAVATYKGTNKRILFNRGDTFVAPGVVTITDAGPGIIGSYGVGALPFISMPAINVYAQMIKFSSAGLDWRVMDLAFDAINTMTQFGFSQLTAAKQVTFLRVKTTNFDTHLNFTNIDQLAIFDSEMALETAPTATTSMGLYCANCTKVSLNGNNLHLNTTANAHNVRLQGVIGFVVSNSTHKGYTTIEPITVRGNTQYGVLLDNKFIDNIVTVKPQNNFVNEYQRDIIFDRNWFVAGPNTWGSLAISGSGVTVRNNIFDLSLAPGYGAVNISKSPLSPMPDLVNVYNNTIYNSFANNGNLNKFNAIAYSSTLDTTCRGEVLNNLAYSPNTFNLAPTLFTNYGSCVVVGGNGTHGNSSSFQIKNTSPLFASSTPSVPSDFRLTPGSYGIDTGVAVKVFSDFFRSVRPQGAGYDMGAAESF